jgi:hypothetical protein
MAAGDFDEDACITAHVEQWAATRGTGDPFQWSQVMLESQDPPFPLFQVKWILDGLGIL